LRHRRFGYPAPIVRLKNSPHGLPLLSPSHRIM
jgi:hypothetical protein